MESQQRLRKGSDYVAITPWRWRSTGKLGVTFISLKKTLRETCDSVHSNCTYSPGKEDRERDILYVYATAPSFSDTGQELHMSRDEAASNDLLHVELIDCVHALHSLTGIICRKLCLRSYLEKTGYYNLPRKTKIHLSEVCRQVQTSHIK